MSTGPSGVSHSNVEANAVVDALTEEIVKYEDCTGAAYRIRKGVERTPLQVSIIGNSTCVVMFTMIQI